MKDTKYWLPLIGASVNDPELLESVIISIQKDALMSGFQNTDEEFNMQGIQGNDNYDNEAIYRRLIS